ncbi:unnamed protein product [Hyaloperonospora brassicae]|uniref:Uncharacterized protein n=1 Tax=Hyaloperonospora brassicae TaxID=162125 RepID=A0AAV0TY53_HYABA|nr:unnamed protein product [Hyaloperonospora brassicae]
MGCSQSKATDVARPASVPGGEPEELPKDHIAPANHGADNTTNSGDNTTNSGDNTTNSGDNTTNSGDNTTNSGDNTTNSGAARAEEQAPVCASRPNALVAPESVAVDVPASVRANFSSFNISFIDATVSAPTSATTEPNVASVRVMPDTAPRGDDKVGEGDRLMAEIEEDRVDEPRGEEVALEGTVRRDGDVQFVDRGGSGGDGEKETTSGESSSAVEASGAAEVGTAGADVEAVGVAEESVEEMEEEEAVEVVEKERAGQSSGENEVLELVHVKTGVELVVEETTAEGLVEDRGDLLEGTEAAGSFEAQELVESRVETEVKSVEEIEVAEAVKEEGIVDTVDEEKVTEASVDEEIAVSVVQEASQAVATNVSEVVAVDEPTESVKEEEVSGLVSVGEVEKVAELEKAEVSAIEESSELLKEEQAGDVGAGHSVERVAEEPIVGSITKEKVTELVEEKVVAESVKGARTKRPSSLL